jgi:hypothetical protein
MKRQHDSAPNPRKELGPDRTAPETTPEEINFPGRTTPNSTTEDSPVFDDQRSHPNIQIAIEDFDSELRLLFPPIELASREEGAKETLHGDLLEHSLSLQYHRVLSRWRVLHALWTT